MNEIEIRQEIYVAYVVANSSLADAVEPILYKFLSRAIVQL
jgi:hypothetical protein